MITPRKMAEQLRPLLDRVYLGHHALVEGDRPANAIPRPLTLEKVEAHCEDDGARYGVYPIAPGESTIRCALFDMDSHKGEVTMTKMVEHAKSVERVAALDYGLSMNVFRSSSGKGLHLIMLWQEPQDAYSVRAVLAEVLAAAGFKSGTKGVAKGEIEIFPKQDRVPADGWGNMFVLPFARKSVRLDPLWQPLERGDAARWEMSEPVTVREKPQRAVVVIDPGSTSFAQVAEMLQAIPNTEDTDYDTYVSVAMAVHSATEGSEEGFNLFRYWSAKYPGSSEEEDRVKWSSFGKEHVERPVTIGTLKRLAEKAGWQDLSILANFEILDREGEVVDTVKGGQGVAPKMPIAETDKRTGKLIPTIDCIQATIRHCQGITGMQFKYDNFRARVVRIDDEVGCRPLRDTDYTLVKRRLEARGGFKDVPKEMIRDAIMLVAEYESCDSAQDWLNSLPPWDGVKRIERFYPQYLGTENSAYARAIGVYQWSGMAGRVLDPGCQLDITPIWVGLQGTRKTSAVAALAPFEDFFGSVDLGLKDADFSRKIRGKLIGEIGELKGMGSRDRESIKDMLTRRREEWSEKFVEHATSYPRRIFLIATTNEEGVLDDPTGNRRFAPIRTGFCDTDAIEADRAQLWAEGAAIWRDGGIRFQALGKLQVAAQKEFEKFDPWHDRVVGWLANRPDDDKGITTSGVLEDALYLLPKDHDRLKEMRVAGILRKLGWVRRQCRVDGVRAYRFFDPTGISGHYRDLG